MSYYKKSKEQNRLYYLVRWIKRFANVDITKREVSLSHEQAEDYQKTLTYYGNSKSAVLQAGSASREHKLLTSIQTEFGFQIQTSIEELTFRLIDIDTNSKYYAGSNGKIYRKLNKDCSIDLKHMAEVAGHLHQAYVNGQTYDKFYRRLSFKLKTGKRFQPYVHRIIALSFGIITKEQFADPSVLVGHVNDQSEDNRPTNLKIVTPRENQVDDRKKNGTYHDRGGCSKGKDPESVAPCQNLSEGICPDDHSFLEIGETCGSCGNVRTRAEADEDLPF